MNIKPSSPSERRLRGFTLVELMMVVGLMLLVLKLTLPSLKGLMGGTAGSMARSQLIGDLNSARAMALRNGSPVYVVFMPLYTEVVQVSGDVDPYLAGEGNSMLAEQSIGYALYADYLPGDQPSAPSKNWLTDWKRLPAGFYFVGEDLANILDSADASREDVLIFNNLKNGHSRGSANKFGNFMERKMRLPYLMYNSRGEMAAKGNSGEMRVGDFYLKLTEGGVLPARDGNGTYSLTDADREDPSVAANRKRVWLSINGITGRAGVLEQDPVKKELYEMWVHSLSDLPGPHMIAKEVETGLSKIEWPDGKRPTANKAWAGKGMWGSRDTSGVTGIVPGNLIFIGNGNPKMKRPAAVKGIPRAELMRLIAHLRRIDPRIELRYRRK
jgi:type II secretory pathway pseudopilin PulG